MLRNYHLREQTAAFYRLIQLRTIDHACLIMLHGPLRCTIMYDNFI